MKTRSLIASLALWTTVACGAEPPAPRATVAPLDPDPSAATSVATFAGGCFWCMEPPFDRLEGVVSTTSGYMGGEEDNPTYKQVAAGITGHAEVVQVAYDPDVVSYQRLLEVFWHNIDPTVKDRQFCDWGTQYRTVIFTHDDEQARLARASLAALEAEPPFDAPIVTPIEPAGDFWPAEEYHQDFYLKDPSHYKRYRRGCGRDARLEELWGDLAGH